MKDAIVRSRGYKVLRQAHEDVSFSYRPAKCKQSYRVVALRKDLSVKRGDQVVFSDYRYFFSHQRLADDRPRGGGRGARPL